jgi:serine/threonine protein kinase/Tol biopolymer transport system component
VSLQIGQRLGSYEIASLAGKGGMGEVYRAHDTKLKRDVAIKILPDEFSRDVDRATRFQREAEALASLNHQNIAAIYDVQQWDNTRFLILEFVEGETLADILKKRGALPVDEAIEIATQICDALEAAHEKGIVHRDLKPANIKITPAGKVKVLDFGLAKALEHVDSSPDLSNSPTLSVAATNAGCILGTASYMSPEQVKGRPMDRRTDIFAFGCLLYEMVTGRATFEGEGVADILSRVLQREPDWSRVPSAVPVSMQKLMRLCLEKDLHKRRQAVGDVRIDLEQIQKQADDFPIQRARSMRSPWIVSAAALLVASLFAIPAARHLLEIPQAEMRLQIVTPSSPAPLEFALSPDGRYVVVVASGDGAQRLWLRALDRAEAQPIMGTEGADFPFWSADGRSIGYFASGRLYRIELSGGRPQALANAPAARGGAWNANGTIVFAATNGPLMRVSASGGEPAVVTRIDSPRQTSHRWPQFLSDGRHFLFYSQGTAEAAGIYLASLDGGEPKRLLASNIAATYLSPDHILYMRQGSLVAQRLDITHGQLMGEPIVIADVVAVATGINRGGFSASANGRIAYRAIAPNRQLAWFDRTGKPLGGAGDADSNDASSPELSPDSRRVLIHRTAQNNTDIWIRDLVRNSLIRFTVNQAIHQLPLWSPDGTQIAYLSSQAGPGNLYAKPSNGVGQEKLLWATPNNKAPQDWSKDGRFLMYVEVDPKSANDLWALDLMERKPRAIANTPFDEKMGQFSPNGRWVAYATNESGRFEVVVQSFPDPSEKSQVSTNGGTAPRWSADSKELYFIAPDGHLMVARITSAGTTVESGSPQSLFPTRLTGSGIIQFKPEYAVSSDGRFLINEPVEESGASTITLILNWNPPGK